MPLLLADAASHLGILSMMKLEDAGYLSRLAVALHSCSCDSCLVLSNALADRSQAAKILYWRAPEAKALVEGCSRARPGSYLGIPQEGHAAGCPAAPWVSMVVLGAVDLVWVKQHLAWAAGWRRPGSSVQLRHSVRSALADWSR